MFEKQLTKFRDALQEKAGSIFQESQALTSKGATLSQQDAVALAQMRIRSLTLLDIADIITKLL